MLFDGLYVYLQHIYKSVCALEHRLVLKAVLTLTKWPLPVLQNILNCQAEYFIKSDISVQMFLVTLMSVSLIPNFCFQKEIVIEAKNIK